MDSSCVCIAYFTAQRDRAGKTRITFLHGRRSCRRIHEYILELPEAQNENPGNGNRTCREWSPFNALHHVLRRTDTLTTDDSGNCCLLDVSFLRRYITVTT